VVPSQILLGCVSLPLLAMSASSRKMESIFFRVTNNFTITGLPIGQQKPCEYPAPNPILWFRKSNWSSIFRQATWPDWRRKIEKEAEEKEVTPHMDVKELEHLFKEHVRGILDVRPLLTSTPLDPILNSGFPSSWLATGHHTREWAPWVLCTAYTS
jgi:hypothetical protein